MIIVKEEEQNIRIDCYLAEKLDMSRTKIQKLLADESITVNKKAVPSNYKVKEKDEIEILEEKEEEVNIVPENIPLEIIYEDSDLLVINKKSGMVVHPAPGHNTNTLVNALLYRYPLSGNDKIRPGIVHRLDKDTSGLILVAKNDWTQEKLSDMFKNKEIQKHYLAIVEGKINHQTGTIDAPIGRDEKDRQKMKVTDKNSKEAITHFNVLEQFKNHTLIECILETGRTHQIRVHMAYIGHPIMNDPVYNHKKATSFGQMLHAKSLSFVHPRTKQALYFEVDAPIEFQECLEQLRKDE